MRELNEAISNDYKIASSSRLARLRGYIQGHATHTSRLFSRNTPNKSLISKLLEYIVAGNQDQAKELLAAYPELVMQRAVFTDWSNRTFNCSPFEYILWALDVKYMGNMILDCLPENEQGESIRIELLKQAQSLQTNGLRYKLNGTIYQEKHINLEPLKSVLKNYIAHYNDWSKNKRTRYCCTIIGKVQALLPAHIRQHYCDPEESFCPTPSFTKEQFTRTLEIKNLIDNNEYIWDRKLVGLGITRWALTECRGSDAVPKRMYEVDLAAISALEKTRMEIDLPQLFTRLNSPIQKINSTQTP